MKRYLLAAFVAGLPGFAEAKDFAIPKAAAFASVTLPDDWSADMVDAGVEAASKDGKVHLAFEVVKVPDAGAGVGAAATYLTTKGVKLNASSKKQQEEQLGDLQGLQARWTGTDKYGAAQATVRVLVAGEDRLVMLAFWGSPEASKAKAKELAQIVESLKSIQ